MTFNISEMVKDNMSVDEILSQVSKAAVKEFNAQQEALMQKEDMKKKADVRRKFIEAFKEYSQICLEIPKDILSEVFSDKEIYDMLEDAEKKTLKQVKNTDGILELLKRL